MDGDGICKLPIAEIFHGVYEELDGEIRSPFLLCGEKSSGVVSGEGIREVISMEIVVGEAGSEIGKRAGSWKITDFEKEFKFVVI